MKGKLLFHYNPADDYVLFTFRDFKVEDEQDIADWYSAVAGYFAQFKGKKKDVLLDISGLDVSAKMGKEFGALRARFEAEFFQRSYRFNAQSAGSSTRTFAVTSGIVQKIPFTFYASQDEALAALKKDR